MYIPWVSPSDISNPCTLIVIRPRPNEGFSPALVFCKPGGKNFIRWHPNKHKTRAKIHDNTLFNTMEVSNIARIPGYLLLQTEILKNSYKELCIQQNREE